ncbi:MAG TPA: ABC transporter ATP-binding protein [Candidatus Acidoferrales bacterium]|jgi:putative ABC transport system ATP-binding protein|nr:ABC transporter ATP-binding protein [Candidatus Acidoferrales bacterium]
MLQLKGICKSYYTDELETRALLDINMTVERGEYISIEGPSGCGKSTLLSILGLLDSPSSGSYTLNGHAMLGLSINERAAVRNRAIGFIFQNFNLIGDLDVCSNVELPLIYRGVTPRERKRRVEEVLERVGLEHRARHSPAALSGGQQQRVAVARALAGYPSVLLADEPTGNLDTANGESVMEMLADLHAEGATIVMVTHDRRFARYADRTIGLLDGRLTDSLEPVELRL